MWVGNVPTSICELEASCSVDEAHTGAVRREGRGERGLVLSTP